MAAMRKYFQYSIRDAVSNPHEVLTLVEPEDAFNTLLEMPAGAAAPHGDRPGVVSFQYSIRDARR